MKLNGSFLQKISDLLVGRTRKPRYLRKSLWAKRYGSGTEKEDFYGDKTAQGSDIDSVYEESMSDIHSEGHQYTFSPYMDIFEISSTNVSCTKTYFAKDIVEQIEDEDEEKGHTSGESGGCGSGPAQWANLNDANQPNMSEILGITSVPGIFKWVIFYGVHEEDIVHMITGHFGIHPLVVEDILNPEESAKLDFYKKYIFAVLKIAYADVDGYVSMEQVSFLGLQSENLFFSFQESRNPILKDKLCMLRNRELRTFSEELVGKDVSFMFSLFLDAVVDSYVDVVSSLSERLDGVEAELLTTKRPKPPLLREIYWLKRDIHYLLATIWPVRDFVRKIMDGDCMWEFNKLSKPYFRDISDHITRALDMLNIFRELVIGMQSIYVSNVGNRSNEIMRVLTVISTIFLPISTLAGIFGMNFENMPDLRWKYGYFVFWIFILTSSFVYLVLLKISKIL